MRWTASILMMVVFGLVLQTAQAHVTFWSADCEGHVCCSSPENEEEESLPFSDSDDNELCHPFDSCHSCLHILPDLYTLSKFKIEILFPSPVWSVLIPNRDVFPYEGPPPK